MVGRLERVTTIAVAVAVLSCGDPYAASAPQKAAQTKAQTDDAPPSVEVITAPANGWGDAIQWEPLDAGLAHAKAAGKPLMLVAHADWCRMCKALKPTFFDPTLAALSKRFVMVNLNVDRDPVSQTEAYTPDGRYVPRVMFVDPQTGTVDVALRNEGRSKDRYFYTRNDDLLAVMKKALSRYERT